MKDDVKQQRARELTRIRQQRLRQNRADNQHFRKEYWGTKTELSLLDRTLANYRSGASE